MLSLLRWIPAAAGEISSPDMGRLCMTGCALMRCFIQILSLVDRVITVYVPRGPLMTGVGKQKHCHVMEIAV